MSKINRRSLLGAGVGGLLAGRAFASNSMLRAVELAAELAPPPFAPPKQLFIFMRGGLDGVSAVVPTGDPTYVSERQRGTSTCLVTGATPLTAFASLHPLMANWLMPAWNANELAFIHQVGNPNGSRSHFTEMHRLETGDLTSPAATLPPDGVVPRLLTAVNSTYPLAGATVSTLVQRLFKSGTNPMVHVRDVPAFAARTFNPRLVAHLAQTPTDPVEIEVDRVADKMLAAQQDLMNSPAFVHDPVLFPWGPTDPNPLAFNLTPPRRKFLQDLEGAVHLLLNTNCRVAGVELGAFDTHNDQLLELDPILDVLAFAIASVRTKAGTSPLTTFAISEFGRSAQVNGNSGTDHGKGGLMIACGYRVIRNVFNCHGGGGAGAGWTSLSLQSSLPNNHPDWNCVPVATSYLAILEEIIQKLFGITNFATKQQVLPGLTAPSTLLGFLN